jgi:hypothetical protein
VTFERWLVYSVNFYGEPASMPVHKSRLKDACAEIPDGDLFAFDWRGTRMSPEAVLLVLRILDLLERLRELRRLRAALANWLHAHPQRAATTAGDAPAEAEAPPEQQAGDGPTRHRHHRHPKRSTRHAPEDRPADVGRH